MTQVHVSGANWDFVDRIDAAPDLNDRYVVQRFIRVLKTETKNQKKSHWGDMKTISSQICFKNLV